VKKLLIDWSIKDKSGLEKERGCHAVTVLEEPEKEKNQKRRNFGDVVSAEPLFMIDLCF